MAYGVVAVLLAVVLSTACFDFTLPQPPMGTPLKTFSSYEELEEYLANSRARYWSGLDKMIYEAVFEPVVGLQVAEYSTTNIQVEGVDEADIVKNDGEYIYLASENTVVIVKAYPPEDAETTSTINLNGRVTGLFVNGDRLIVFEENFTGPWEGETSIKIYDISDRGKPVLKRDVSFNGWYLNSRMIGDYVYEIVNTPSVRPDGNETDVNLPKIYTHGRVEEVPATQIHYADFLDYYYVFTTIVAVNVKDDSEKPTHETILTGPTTCMYVSLNNIYVAIPNFVFANAFGMFAEEVESTLIYRIHIEAGKITCEANGEVSGIPLNQFSMDEYKGFFRLATTTGRLARSSGEATAKNYVYVLDANLTVVGKLEDLAPGERIYSARFMGDRCYLVTFRKVDPLFTIDMSSPEEPRVLGKLKIPGYSDYLHPYDEDHLIGIGKEAVPAEEGDFSWYQGVKIALFDVSDISKPKEVDKHVIGDRGTETPVLWDHKAFLFDRSRNLLVFPVLVAEIDREKYSGEVPPQTFGEYVFQGAYVFKVSLDTGIVLRGKITHIENDDLLKSGYYFGSQYSVKRALYIGNVLYTISEKKIKANSLEDLGLIGEVELP